MEQFVPTLVVPRGGAACVVVFLLGTFLVELGGVAALFTGGLGEFLPSLCGSRCGSLQWPWRQLPSKPWRFLFSAAAATAALLDLWRRRKEVSAVG